jgi:hypothetical protein
MEYPLHPKLAWAVMDTLKRRPGECGFGLFGPHDRVGTDIPLKGPDRALTCR